MISFVCKSLVIFYIAVMPIHFLVLFLFSLQFQTEVNDFMKILSLMIKFDNLDRIDHFFLFKIQAIIQPKKIQAIIYEIQTLV